MQLGMQIVNVTNPYLHHLLKNRIETMKIQLEQTVHHQSIFIQ